MPRAVQFKVASIAELFRQLEYAPPETRLRQMDATERLIDDIDPQQNYPEDFIVYRITGYRPDRVDEPVTLVGEALLADLVNLVLHMSKGMGLPPDHEGRTALSLEQASARLHVSTKSLQRYRRRGLACHHVRWPDDVERVSCFADSLERFTARHQRQVEKAATFSRMDRAEEKSIISEARQLRQQKYLSLNEAAQQLARTHGRAHETIRQLLRRHDRRAAEPIFRDSRPLQDRMIRRIYRAWRFGVDPEAIAKRYRKSKPTIHRAVNHHRAELIKSLRIKHVRLPTFDLPDAEEVILSSPVVATGLDQAWMEVDVWTFIHDTRQSSEMDDSTVIALIAAYNMLKTRAQAGIAGLGEHPRSHGLDQIETDLRWTTALKRRLLRLALPAAMARVEQNLHRPLSQQTFELVKQVLRLSIDVCSKTIESIDPSRGQSLDGMIRLAMDRALAKSSLHDVAGRAAVHHHVTTAGLRLSSLIVSITGWEWLNPPWDWRSRLAALDDLHRGATELRFGWTGDAPKTISVISRNLHVSPIVVVRMLREGEVMLRRAKSGA